jgi:hypothetical protein
LFTPYREQLAEFGLMSRHVSRKLAEMDLSVRMRKEGNEDAWKFVLTTDVGKEHMEAIREQSAKLAASSVSKMEQGQEQIRRTLQLSRIGVATMALAGLLAFYMYLLQTKACSPPAGASRSRCNASATFWRCRCAKGPPTWPSWPPTCRMCAKTSAATWRVSCTTNWARC